MIERLICDFLTLSPPLLILEYPGFQLGGTGIVKLKISSEKLNIKYK